MTELTPPVVILDRSQLADNIGSAEQISSVAWSVRRAVAARGYPAFVGIDQEGGPVARIKAPVTQLPGGMAYGAADDAELAAKIAKGQGQELRALGVTMVFAPDADVTVGPQDPTIAVRSPCRAAERRSMAAERDTTDRYLAAYLADRVGSEFTGRVSGVQRFGAFVKLDETGADGLLPIREIGNEYFHYDRDAQTLVGSETGTQIVRAHV